MIILRVLFLVVYLNIFFCCCKLYSQTQSVKSKVFGFYQLTHLPDLNQYNLVIEDNFNGTTLDKKIWGFYRQGDTIQDCIYFQKNATVKNGQLFLTVDIMPHQLFKYGYFEISAKLPTSIGDEAAFWFFAPGMSKTYPKENPSVYGAEIDVFEYSANNFDNLFYSLHWNGYEYKNGAKVTTRQEHVPGISKGYHTYALEWTPKEYIVYVDNKERIRNNTIISRSPEIMILGFGAGGFAGKNYLGPWPDTFAIDYVKIYNRKPAVRLYGDDDGYGWISDDLLLGNYTTKQLLEKNFFNNDASAIEVPKGWQVTAFDDDNFTGNAVVIIGDKRQIGNNLNNKISSLKISLIK
jgi:Glycosyl hydrolases family 16